MHSHLWQQYKSVQSTSLHVHSIEYGFLWGDQVLGPFFIRMGKSAESAKFHTVRTNLVVDTSQILANSFIAFQLEANCKYISMFRIYRPGFKGDIAQTLRSKSKEWAEKEYWCSKKRYKRTSLPQRMQGTLIKQQQSALFATEKISYKKITLENELSLNSYNRGTKVLCSARHWMSYCFRSLHSVEQIWSPWSGWMTSVCPGRRRQFRPSVCY